MPTETDATRLAVIKAGGGETFDTGYTESLWAIFDIPTIDSDGAIVAVQNRQPELACRESDVVAHSLVKQSPIRRIVDDKQYSVRKIAVDGTGMATIMLKSA